MKRLLILLLFAGIALGQTKAGAPPPYPRHHVVVLIDRSPSTRYSLTWEKLSQFIEQDLYDTLFQTSRTSNGRKLLEPGDYLSVLSFGLDADARNFKQFIPKDFALRTVEIAEGNKKEVLRQVKNQIGKIGFDNFFKKRYGVGSIAKPFALHELRNSNIKVNRTFVLTITDGKYNAPGQEPLLELQAVQTLQLVNHINLDISQPLGICENFMANYALLKGAVENRHSGYLRAAQRAPNFRLGWVGVDLYEAMPLQLPLTADALIRPTIDKIQFRQPSFFNGGRCTADLSLVYNKTSPLRSIYGIDSLYAALTWKNETVWSASFGPVQEDVPLKIEIADKYVGPELKFNLRYWVAFADTCYGMHVLYPDGDAWQGALGLNRPIETDPEVFRDRTWIYYAVILAILAVGAFVVYLSRKTYVVK